MCAGIELQLGRRRLQVKVDVPAAAARRVDLLPLLQNLADAVVTAAADDVDQQGQAISCKKGCAACCRQLVLIGPTEARRLRALIDAMPERRRADVLARFAQARERLGASSLLDKF